MARSRGRPDTHNQDLQDSGGAQEQGSFRNRPFLARRLPERAQPVDVVECLLAEPSLAAKLDPAMIRVVRNKHAQRAQFCPYRFVLPIHVIRCMKIVVKESVDERTLVQQLWKRGPHVFKDQSMAVPQRASDLIRNCPTYSALLPCVQRTIGQCPPRSDVRRQLDRKQPAPAILNQRRAEKGCGYPRGNSGLNDILWFKCPCQPIKNLSVVETDPALPVIRVL